MKSLKCDNCEFEAKGETFDDWFKAMLAHWKSEHADLMKAMGEKPGSKEEQEKWMVEARRKFDAA